MLKVLVVDDEDAIRRVLRRALERERVEVHTAESVGAARRFLEALPVDAIDAAFLDVWLGGESGFELYAWIEDERPQLAPRVVFTTGDVVNDRTQQALSALGRPVLAKPFHLSELLAHVHGWAKESG